MINDKISKSENGLPHLVHFPFQHKCLYLLTLLVILNFAFPPLKKKQNKTKQIKGKKKLHKRAMKIFRLLVVRIKKHISLGDY